ncbi:hypothetical protein H1P_280030 [Hyella patelloides LEGE 07179]|uniref:Uncharacterized protein n=1 Tax=Hyella patelloides LEGE 07179 TaxID=945734 RepID=A0A563VTI9_9CYAN|nr:hypothetical protein H1P_280030 [Hyella patelloides LEGE 07179]
MNYVATENADAGIVYLTNSVKINAIAILQKSQLAVSHKP